MPRRLSSFLAVIASVSAVVWAAVLVVSAPASAIPAHGASLAPPVIHESYTPLPCAGAPAHRSTLQDEGCAEQQILKSDKAIDALNRLIFAKLPSNSARRDFSAGHRAWFAYRRAYCLSASDVFQGGTEAGVVDADCAARVNAQHVTNLKGFLADLGPN
jgi:uncharacterized protein YecT (DUF1311 family)